MRALLLTFSWQELRHHPWRNAAAVVAVMLGVALAFSVHLINASALDEFSSAVRSVNGQPDLELRAAQGSFDEALFARVARHPQVALASPVIEVSATALMGDRRLPLRIVGVDALVLPTLAPALMPVPAEGSVRFSLFAPGQVFLNAAARTALGDTVPRVTLQLGAQRREVQIAGSVSAGGTALAVMDIGAAQELFGRIGQLTRIDLRLADGIDRATFTRALEAAPGWPTNVRIAEPGDAAERVSNLSRAYRVNLTVLALVALFTGAFLVFSVLALSVAKRAQQFALLGVLGLTPRGRLGLVLAESLLLGAVGSIAGIALGAALAAFALKVLGGDLGGGYFAGVAPTLRWNSSAALLYGALGIAAAGVGGWWPARAAQSLPEAQTLKGLGATAPQRGGRIVPLALLAIGVVLARLPPIADIPVAAYVSVGFLLVGGITALPWLIALLYDRIAPAFAQRVLPMLAIERARRMRGTAAVAVSGVVASLSLAVALTVMVASFRDSVTRWLDVVLPADLYLRVAGSTGSTGGDDAAFTPAFVQRLAQLPGVARTGTLRLRPLLLDPARPAVSLIGRSFEDGGAARTLPLVGEALPVPAGQIGIYVSEAMVDLYGARPGTTFAPLAQALGTTSTFFVAGVWRDYVRQFGTLTMDARDFERLTGDRSASDVALWLAPGAAEGEVQAAVRKLAADEPGLGDAMELSSVAQIRATSLRIFDRSFAVTYWLQAVAIAIGLFGIAASFSAQVLARRKEFGLMAHLGFTRRQVLAVVAGEGAAWTAIGAVAGLALGLAVSVVLVHVVNPQSFHWTMDLLVPWWRLVALCAAVVAAGTLTAWLAGRAAAGRDAVLAVKEDW
ncbi:FtsX-like permease family protein [Variovorax arabinosiphilus]|uniref:FtsX-like permease family protein n=1 Tax=Variovorax arabinosiphilus TaxID=3053498 RepID=UPI002576196D|nr:MULTISPECIES: ABC transporter permease [unclassified Variovorax]MDM0119449.1 FtsX-like permease family protein [Variovorax sp. J2L1-78]MDM0129875.1 FtsX-like permease family protein [Variovorax sp. J2L1-63]MDM0232339.1 FtsX-like permease family protein [Variovorax sp. J2R1-6]